MIEGHIETVSPDGVIHGWLRDSRSAEPAHVQVLHGGTMAAEASARDFRQDLLLTGHGHGHHGFRARLRVGLPPGPCSVVLHLPDKQVSAPMAVTVPRLEPARPASVEALLSAPAGWTDADLLARPDCLDMAAQYTALGAPRFVDAVFRFVLDRWPSAAEGRMHVASLQARRVTPEALLVEVLGGRERSDRERGLASPYDPEFPFLVGER